MTCESCEREITSPNCKSCKGFCDIDKQTLADFRRCEPWCSSGPGCVRPGPSDCGGGACSLEGKALTPTATLLLAAVKGGCVQLCTDANGKAGFKLPGAAGPCIVSLGELDCQRFGPHFNALRRSPNISPLMAEAIAATYEFETVTVTTSAESLAPGGWFGGALGALGLSHQFCVYELSAVVNLAVPVPGVIIGAGVGGERAVCGDGANGDEGFYVLAADTPRKADPEELTVTDGRCKCRDLCALTPADGLEFIYAQVTLAGGLPVPVDTTITITARVSRCNWFVLVDPCIGPLGNRLTTGQVVTPRPEYRSAATVPFL